MTTTNTTTKIGTGAALLLALAIGSGPATAQSAIVDSGTVSDVQVAVQSADDKAELFQLRSGEGVRMSEGDVVNLRVFFPRGAGPGGQRGYLAARWTLQSGNRQIRLADNPSRGIATVTGLQAGQAELSYQLIGNIQVTSGNLASGRITITVEGASRPAPPPAGGGGATTDAEVMVRDLYRGILMREPDDDAQGWVREIASGGYPAVVEVAEKIAASGESRVGIYDRGHTHHARLVALYKHLLDLDQGEIDQYQYQDHLELLERHRIVEVVGDIVRSPEFRRVHGYQDGR